MTNNKFIDSIFIDITDNQKGSIKKAGNGSEFFKVRLNEFNYFTVFSDDVKNNVVRLKLNNIKGDLKKVLVFNSQEKTQNDYDISEFVQEFGFKTLNRNETEWAINYEFD